MEWNKIYLNTARETIRVELLNAREYCAHGCAGENDQTSCGASRFTLFTCTL